MKKIKFAVVGFGHIGKRHAKIIHEHPESELKAYVDIDAERLEDGRVLGYDAQAFNSIEDFLAAGLTDIDVVSICTPNYLHAPYAIQLLEERYHVVIEKPMALSRAACEQVVFKSLQVSRNVFVVKQNRYSPPSKWLKSIVQDGTLGDIHLVQINCYWNRDERYYNRPTNKWKGSLEKDGGTLFTQFSHFIDIMYWILGDVKNVNAKFWNFTHQHNTEFEDSGLVHFEFVNGGLGCLNFSTACWGQNMESSITIVGSKGSVKVGGQYMNEVEYCHIENYEMPELEPTNPPNDYGPYKGSAANHHYIIQNVVDTLLGRDSIDTNALEGLKVVDIIERIYASRELDTIMLNPPQKIDELAVR